MEQPVRDKMLQLEPFSNAKRGCSSNKISFSKKPKDTQTSLSFYSLQTIDQIVDLVFALKKDCGLDGFQLVRESQSCILVDICQIKLGELHKTYGLGTDSATDASQYFNAALKKANSGWDKLQDHLKVTLK